MQTVWPRSAGPNRIRKELQVVVRVLRDARLWGQEEEEALLRLRPVEPEAVRALTIEEQHRFLHAASSREAFRLIYHYARVALQTTASTNELRTLRLCDVLLDDRVIQIPPAGGKNKYRVRSIPLVTEDAVWAMEGLLERARALGASRPTDYVFPLRTAPNRWDPSQPMSESGLKKQWHAVRRAAELPALRLYDLRHTGITRMAEAGVPLAVTMTFAGHMTQRMQQRYTAICMASQRDWGAAVWADGRHAPSAPGVSRAREDRLPARKPVSRVGPVEYQTGQPSGNRRAFFA